MIASANKVHGFIEEQAKKALDGIIVLKSGESIGLDAKKFSVIDPSLKGEVLRMAIEHVRKDLADISFVHIQSIIGNEDKKTAELDLPGAYVLIKKGKLLISRSKPARSISRDFAFTLPIPGTVSDMERGFEIEADLLPSRGISDLKAKNPNRACLDYDKISGPLTVRRRRAGDSFSPLGLKGRKKLQDIFVDEKVDIDKRDSIPVIDDGKKIVWVVGYRMSEDAKVTKDTKKVVRLSARTIG